MKKSSSAVLLLFFALPTLFIEELEVFLAELERLGEVFLAHNLVFSELLGSALEEDFSFEEQVGTVGDGECLVDVMVGDEDSDVAVLQLPDDLLDVLHGNRVDAGERFVENDELRLDGQTAGYLRAATLTTGELVTFVLAHLAQTELGDEALQCL